MCDIKKKLTDLWMPSLYCMRNEARYVVAIFPFPEASILQSQEPYVLHCQNE